MPSEYEVQAIFNVSDLIPFMGIIDDEGDPPNLRTNHFQEGREDGKPLAKGPTTRVVARRI